MPSLVALLLVAVAAVAPDDAGPNIVFIFSDDHATHAISAYGSRINRTPHIDRLADEGAIFRNSFCTNSICAPSRAVVLTGAHSHVNGVRTNDPNQPFDGSQVTFPKLLREAGYQTALVGKWHLRSDPTGFDHWEVLPGQGAYYNPDFRTPDGTTRRTGHCTAITTDRALRWLEEERDPERPFLLMLQHKAPHRTWMPGPDHLATYQGETIPEPDSLFFDHAGMNSGALSQEMTVARHLFPRYDLKIDGMEHAGEPTWDPRDRLDEQQRALWDAHYGPRNDALLARDLAGDDLVRAKYQRYVKDYLRCVQGVDDSVGRVLDWLDAAGLAEDTIVIYSSDQGFYLGDRGWYDKRWMYEPSLRMPLLVRWPGTIEPGTEVDALVQNLDYAPTFCALAGVPAPERMQGRSLLPWLMTGEPPDDWRDAIYYRYYETPQPHAVPRQIGIRTATHKLIWYHDLEEWEMFDLVADPGETVNLAELPEHAALRAALTAGLRDLQEHAADEDVPRVPTADHR